METYKQYDTGISVLEADGQLKRYNSSIPNISYGSLIDLQLMMMKINRNCRKINTLDPFIRLSHASALDRENSKQFYMKNSMSQIAQAILRVAFRAIYGLEPEQISNLYATFYIKSSGGTIEAISLTEKDCAQEKRVKGGTQQISQRLLDNILSDSTTAKILLETPVIEVNQQDPNRVLVKVSNVKEKREEVYSCRRLVSAIPLTQYCKIKFEPALPVLKKNVFEFCKTGNYAKYVITYKTAFWREKGYSAMVVSDGSILDKNINNLKYGPVSLVFDGTTDDGEPALVVFSCAQPSVEWSDQHYDLRRDAIINALCRYFGNEAANYVDFCEKNWNFEPYNGGCPTINIVASGVMSNYAQATREPFLNMHLCGTESATEWMGYMDGAIESGIRAANEVAYCFSTNNSNIKFDFSKTYYYQKSKILGLKKVDNKEKRKSWLLLQIGLLLGVSAAFLYNYRDKLLNWF